MNEMADMKFDITKVVNGAIKEFRHQGYNVSKWISCKEEMPDDGVNVLIYTGNRMISLAWYDKDMGYFYICDSDYKYNSLDVTHWQPLPKPPMND